MAVDRKHLFDQMTQPIGVFDSGVGGLTVLDALVRVLPQEQFVYFADTQWMPYGSKDPEAIAQRAEQIIQWFIEEHHVKMVIIACNTASSVLAQRPKRAYPVPVLNTLLPTCQWLVTQPVHSFKKIGIIATQGTIQTNGFGRVLEDLQAPFEVRQVPVESLASLIEAGKAHTSECEAVLHSCLTPLMEWGMDALIFGCTHYPWVYQQVDTILPKDILLIDPAHFLANTATIQLQMMGVSRELARGVENHGNGSVQYCVSQDPQTFLATAKTLPLRSLPLAMPDSVELPEYPVTEKRPAPHPV